ncbi:MAG TPA: Imm10 family immunity protein [Verrucomicrobiales bacterium]|nr:Imm10 family immunity protein [Verrucomicrobiales bacterium]
MNLVAAEVYFHPNDDIHCATVGFRAADHSYFLLSRALAPTQQDRRLGHDAVYIELSDQGLGCYDGVSAVSVFPALVRFDLNERGKRATHQSIVEIRHSLALEQSLQLRQVLALVFDGFPRYADCG